MCPLPKVPLTRRVQRGFVNTYILWGTSILWGKHCNMEKIIPHEPVAQKSNILGLLGGIKFSERGNVLQTVLEKCNHFVEILVFRKAYQISQI